MTDHPSPMLLHNLNIKFCFLQFRYWHNKVADEQDLIEVNIHGHWSG